MKSIQLLSAIWLMSGALASAEAALSSDAVQAPVAMSATLPGNGTIGPTSTPEHRRTFVLVLGIAAVAVTFHRGISGRRQAH